VRPELSELEETGARTIYPRTWGAVFLCSRAGHLLTGGALPVDGGFSSSLF